MKKILVLGLVLALVAILVAPMAVFAGTTDTQTTAIDGTFAAISFTISPPGALNFGTFSDGDNEIGPYAGYVTVNYGSGTGTGWTVTAKDVTSAYLGYMSDGYGNYLSLLQIYSPTSSWQTADAGVTWSGTVSGNLDDFYAKQNIVGTEAAGTYYITITFSGGITP